MGGLLVAYRPFYYASFGVFFDERKKIMDAGIIISIITGALSLTGVILTNMNSNRKIEQQLQISMAVTDTKLEALTKQVEKHNQIVERTFKLEQIVEDIRRENK